MKKARAEPDAVCGEDANRLATFDDWDKFPYIQAIINETMRWRPIVSPLGFPHVLSRDDTYEGYVLSAGTTVTINQWALCFNQKEYDDHLRFKPDRFLNDKVWDPIAGHYGFGAGRRACSGYRVAANSLFILFSRFTYCFDVEEDPVRCLLLQMFSLHAQVRFNGSILPTPPHRIIRSIPGI